MTCMYVCNMETPLKYGGTEVTAPRLLEQYPRGTSGRVTLACIAECTDVFKETENLERGGRLKEEAERREETTLLEQRCIAEEQDVGNLKWKAGPGSETYLVPGGKWLSQVRDRLRCRIISIAQYQGAKR
ncbi:hypothetical protein NDU88_001973 [Pleurodeles waltl]|uniref:Uncharacterized protein n=1 Tax=Pleurodeles waltl TaxID=8319 RepID=A0AAV7NCN6_PLEWA|nr:hypothetical protein NDU88_001973 [Pleurodeles waltl]